MAISRNQISDKVWNYLIKEGFTKQGAAGLMGNIHSQSGMIPNRVEMLCLRRLRESGYGNYTDASYTAAVDNGNISKERFIHPLPNKQYGYGLCQWTSPGRKTKLYDLVKSKNKSIGDIDTQLEFLMTELKNSYQSVYNVLKTTTSIKTASDKVLKDFESPSNWSSHSATRTNYSQQYYNLYNTTSTTPSTSKVQSKINFNNYYGKISNSGKDERGSYANGKAGDQGGEWQIRSWYNRPWNCVLRYPNIEVGKMIAELGIEAANNNLVGYDQNERYSYWNHLKASNYRPSQITIACQSDCSAGVIANTKAVGYLLNIPALQNINATYTGNMRSGFKAAGFQVLTASKYLNSFDYLMPGDILLNDAHHTATNLGIGKNSGYNSSNSNSNLNIPSPTIEIGKNITSTKTSEIQKMLNQVGNYGLVIDNDYGPATTKAVLDFQKKNNLEVDGIVGNKTLSKLNELTKKPAAASSVQPKTEYNKKPKTTGTVTANALYVRQGPGTNYDPLKSIPVIYHTNRVDICDEAFSSKTGEKWYYIRINGTVYGFCSAKYIKLD